MKYLTIITCTIKQQAFSRGENQPQHGKLQSIHRNADRRGKIGDTYNNGDREKRT